MPVVAVMAVTPLAAASGAGPTGIQVTRLPDIPVPGTQLRLTYTGVTGSVAVPFLPGSTATVSIFGDFANFSLGGATITNQTPGNPLILNLAITDPSGFFVQGTAQSGTSITVTVFDAQGDQIGSQTTAI